MKNVALIFIMNLALQKKRGFFVAIDSGSPLSGYDRASLKTQNFTQKTLSKRQTKGLVDEKRSF